MDPQRLVDLRCGDADASRSYGSGYLVAPQLVLTAAHAVLDRGSTQQFSRIDVRVGHPAHGEPSRRSGQVCWTGPDRTDVALVWLNEPVAVEGLVRWGRPAGGEILSYQGLGFPLLAEYEDAQRRVEQLRGELPSLASGPHGAFVLDQAAAPRVRPGGERAWSGVSGAAVFCSDLLVGVVVRDDAEFDNRRLHATPAHAFVADPEFAALMRRHGDAHPEIDHIGGLAPRDLMAAPRQSALPEPAAVVRGSGGLGQFRRWELLLRREPRAIKVADGEEVLLERTRVLADLVGALEHGPDGRVVVLRGEPGVGKTALALRAVDALRDRSTSAFVASLVAMRRHPGALADLIEQAATASAGPAVLVLDGAEGVLEGNEDLCAEAVEVALAARITPVLVSRDDAADALRALASRLSASEVTDFCVPPLDDEEISTVVGKAPALATLARDPRSRWLLRRLVVVDLLLRSVEQGGEMPPALASEADVYIHVWLALVQNNGRQVRGVMPDDRSGALMSLAEARLTGRRGQALSGPVVGALRSDGLLAPLGAASAVSSDEHAFAHDVLRDFAITRRLLLHDGLEMLDRHGPRCAVRAARIACQVTLRPSAEGSFADRWDETYAQFQHLASLHGPRWEEVPWEALLSAGWCGEALEVLTGRLLREPGLLTALLKCVLLRFVQGGRGDALVLAPVVAWLVQQRTPLLDRAQDESADEIVLQWLRAVAEAEICSLDITEHRGLRVRLRDALLQAAPQYPSDGFVEALALLGTDRGDEVGVLLRELASERPQRLMHAVDRLDAARCLATTDAPLLAELALAYYRPRPSRPRHGASRSYREGGQHEFRDIREQTRAAWYRGPFYVLLSASPQQGTRLINRLLDAQMKSDVVSEGEEARDGLLCIDFPGLETRDYLGDLNSWDWYRGGLNGPQPSMSALMALERFLDDLIQTDTVTVQQAAKAVLQNVGTPAGAGLAYGLLVRHIEQVKDELDGFLACPAVWELELQRVTTGQVFNRLGNRSSDDFRAQPPQRVAMSLVVAAGQRNDQSALKRLQDVGRRLREAPSPGLDVLAVGYWADHLDWERYSVAREGREAVVEVQPSVDIAEGLGQRQAASQLAHTRYELLNRYAHGRRLPHRPLAAENFDQERLLTDIAAARALAESEVDAWDGVCAVAAASLHAVAQGFRVPPDDLEWSLSLLTSIALEQPAEGSPDSHSVFPWGVHRLAALALPSALTSTAGLGSFQLDSATYSRVRSAVIASAGSLVHEVRAFVVEGLRPVWSAACNRGDRPCHHEVAWDSVQAGLQVVLARANAYLCGHGSSRPPVSSLEQLVGEEGSLHALGTLAPAVLEAARTRHCLTTDARALRTPLLKAYARVACAWSDIDHHRIGEQQSAMAAALLRTAVDDPEMVHSLGEELVQSPAAFSHVLYGLKLTATYEPELIEPLGAVWPHLMELVLTQPVRRDPDPRDNDCADEESWAAREQHDESFRTYAQEQLMGELVPQPTLSMGDADMDSTLRRARARWLQLEPFEELIETWTAHKPQSRFAADHLIDFLKTQPVTKQLDPGLRWLRQLVVAPSGEAESHGFALADWLRNLHPFLTKATRVHYQSLVDGLALSGHPQAAALQQLDE